MRRNAFQLIAKTLGLPAGTPEEGVESYAVAVESLRAKVGIPASFQAQGVDEHDFIARLDELAMGSYRDQCAPANPRMPMLADMKELMVAAFYGISIEEARARLADQPVAVVGGLEGLRRNISNRPAVRLHRQQNCPAEPGHESRSQP